MAVPEVEQSRLVRTEIPGPNSRALLARRQAAVTPGLAAVLPVFVERAGGGILQDVDGNRLIDLGSGVAVTSVGNAAPAVVAAASEALGRFTHSCFAVTPYEGYVAVCERLAALTPGKGPKRSILVNSGAEAVENAVKIARYVTGRPGIVVFDHAFHGRTLLGLSMTARDMPYRRGFLPLATDLYRMPYSYPYRCPFGAPGQLPERCAEGCLERAVFSMERQIGTARIAAVVVEPIAGEGGVVVPAPGWLPGLAAWCAENDILLIADEVQTGVGRTGDLFACQYEGVVPDLVTTAKALAGGLPLGAVTGRAEVMDALHSGALGTTFGGNPVSCAAALAVLDDKDLPALARRIGGIVLSRLRALPDRLDVVGDVRGRGAMIGVELVRPGDVPGRPDPELAERVAADCHSQGVLVLTSGTYGNVLRLLPPLVIGDDLLTEGLEVLLDAIERHAGADSP